jgi:ABC-type transport system involved in Fe-S cluster assembly fused permease/ATPase subunit
MAGEDPREMNEQDTDANQKAIDSLLNFETVKYFGAERARGRPLRRRDGGLREAAAIKTSYSLAFLNFGQSLLITGGLCGDGDGRDRRADAAR